MDPVHSGAFVSALSGFAHPARNVAVFGVEPGMKIADFGAGSGAYALLLAKALLGSGVVYAVDIQKDLLRRISSEAKRAGLKNVEVLWSDIEVPGGSKVGDDALDLVLISNLLFQLPDKEAPLREAYRIIRPRGRLIVIDWSEPGTASGARVGPQKGDAVKREWVRERAGKVGFSFLKDFDAGTHHFGLIFKKEASVRA